MSGIFLRSDKDYLVTEVTPGNEVLQEFCAAYMVDYLDNFLTRHIQGHSLKQDALHLTQTGASDLAARLEKILQYEHPFRKSQKGPAKLQEERLLGQETHPSQYQVTSEKHLQLGTHQSSLSGLTTGRSYQIQNPCRMAQGLVPNPPYPRHIMPKYMYPPITDVWPYMMGRLQQQNLYQNQLL